MCLAPFLVMLRELSDLGFCPSMKTDLFRRRLYSLDALRGIVGAHFHCDRVLHHRPERLPEAVGTFRFVGTRRHESDDMVALQ